MVSKKPEIKEFHGNERVRFDAHKIFHWFTWLRRKTTDPFYEHTCLRDTFKSHFFLVNF